MSASRVSGSLLVISFFGALFVGVLPERSGEGSGLSAGDQRMIRVQLIPTARPPFEHTAPAESLVTVSQAVLGSLLVATPGGDLLPGLIEDWRWDYVKECYRLRLKPGLQLTAGREATAEDLEFSLLRGFFSRNRTFFEIWLNGIRGIERIVDSGSYRAGAVSGVKVTSRYEIEIYLKAYNPNFLHALAHPYFTLVPREEFQSDLLTWKRFPVGAGPYRITDEGFVDGCLRLVKKDPAFRGPEQVLLISRELRAGEQVDLSLAVTGDGIPEERLATWEDPLPISVVGLFFSNKHPLGRRHEFRKAVHHALNRPEIARAAPGAVPAFQLLPNRFWGRDDVSKGAHSLGNLELKTLVSSLPPALLVDPLPVPVFGGTKISPRYHKRLHLIEQMLSEVGIAITFVPSQEKFLSLETATKSPMKMVGQVADLYDPVIMFGALRKGTPYVHEATGDEILEKLITEAELEQVKEKKVEAVKRVSQRVSEMNWFVPIYELHRTVFYNRSVIESLGNQDRPLILDFTKLELR